MNRPRRNANKQIQSVGKKDKSGSSHEHKKSNIRRPKAVVRVDPYARKKTINDYYATPLNDDVKLERDEQDFVCCWRVGANNICGINMDSPDDLLQHLLDVHSQKSLKGFSCNWQGCVRVVMHYNSKEDFEEHLRYHTVISPFPQADEEDILDDSGSEVKPDDLDLEESTDSDYHDSSDEEYTRPKKKKRRKSSPPIQVKKVRSESLEVYSQSSGSGTSSSQRPPAAAAPSPVQLSFYRFACMWVVPYPQPQTKNAPGFVTCKRKFQVLEESLDHLVGHHIAKLKSTKQPLKCCWEGCLANEREFETVEDLCAHAKIHTEEKLMSFNSSGTLTSRGSLTPQPVSISSTLNNGKNTTPVVNPVTQTAKKKPVTPKSTHASSKTTPSSSKTSPLVVVKKTPTMQAPKSDAEDADGSPQPQSEDLSWMTSVLHAFMCTKLKRSESPLCPLGKTSCHFCRFTSMKNRELSKDSKLSNDLYEFSLFKAKYEIPGNPFSFATALYHAIVQDEASNHKSRSFEDTFWMKCLETDKPGCTAHPLNQNLINLFPVQFKNCPDCTKAAMSWPTEMHENLVIELRATESAPANVRYPEILSVKGRVYQLSAVVSVTADSSKKENKYFAYIKIKNLWVSKYDRSTFMTLSSEAYNSKAACVVIYTAKVSLLDTENAWVNPQMLQRWYKFGECHESSLLDTEACVQAYVQKTAETDPKDEMPQKKLSFELSPNDESPSADEDKESSPADQKSSSRLVSAFMHRRMFNKANESCIISVLQALLQTTITTVPPKLCLSTHKCYFCNMLSFTRRILSDQMGDPIPPYEFTLFKEDLDITAEEGDPGVYISDLVGEIVNSERANHNTTDAKYKFMVRLQKKSCNCMLSCENYHWPVSPARKNESLMDLMMKCSMYCTQCNVMTSVQPIQMPDNLIVTVETNEQNSEASVHFPDEWAAYNIRYFLAAIVVSDPDAVDSQHYFAYCKVFGKWMRYDDDKVESACSSDILGNKHASVLVYVARELDAYGLMAVLADAQTYKFANVRGSNINVKEEPQD